MNKIPVSRTIAYAYSFTFGHLGTIIGLIWIPMVLATALGFFVMSGYLDSFSAALAQNNPTIAGQAALLLFAYIFVALLLYAMMYVAVTRQALGLRIGGAIAHFELGPAVWRMFGAMLGVFLILMLFYILVLGVGLGGLAAVGGMGNSPTAGGIALGLGLLVFAGVCALIYVAARMLFLLAPVVVVEERIGIARAWELTGGNFWRITLVWLATLLPIILITGIAEALILGPDTVTSSGSVVPTMAEQAARLHEMGAHLPALSGLGFLLSPFLTGLMLGASAFAYRALVPARGAV